MNHSVEFVNENGFHTNTVKGFRGIWKQDFKADAWLFYKKNGVCSFR